MDNRIDAIDFYWRPGCGFCMALDRGLTKAGVPMNKLNIWEDTGHAETVRSVANGSESVPTVIVGQTAMVNPRMRQVVDALRLEAPHLVPEGADEPGALGRLAQRLFGA
jgi:glutaredoxin